jgi:hypothetical protein
MGRGAQLRWILRFRRLVRDYERLPGTLAGLYFVACLMLHRLVGLTSCP